MNLAAFTKQLNSISEAPSVSGNTVYEDITVQNRSVFFTRKSTGNIQTLLIEELFEAYQNEERINTRILRPYITGYKYSPALAILLAGGFYAKNKSSYLRNSL